MGDALVARENDWIESLLPAERARLVGLCAHLSGNTSAAEDLAQETLLEAWRHRWKLHDPDACSPWLTAIARNVCARWRRDRAHRRTGSYRAGYGTERDDSGENLADDFDLEIELERQELSDLLDRAMALLSPNVQAVLIERFIHDSTYAEIAERLAVSEGTVRVRVHRGKLALQRVLTEQFPDESSAYGVTVPVSTGLATTRIWCPLCGNRRLLTRIDPTLGTVTSRCEQCCVRPSDTITETYDRRLVGDLKSYKAIVSRQLNVAAAWHRRLMGGPAACRQCGRCIGVEISKQNESGLGPCTHGWVARCRACNTESFAAAHGLALALPDTQRFWRQHPRMHALAEQAVEADGVQALVVPFASTTGDAQLDVLLALSDFRVLSVHRSSPRGAGSAARV